MLDEVGAGGLPKILLLNKRDRLSEDELETLRREFPEAIFLSSRDSTDVRSLHERILNFFEEGMTEEEIIVPYTAKGLIGDIRLRIRVLSETYTDEGFLLRIRASSKEISRLKTRLLELQAQSD